MFRLKRGFAERTDEVLSPKEERRRRIKVRVVGPYVFLIVSKTKISKLFMTNSRRLWVLS